MIHAVCIYNPASRTAPGPSLIAELRSRLAKHGYDVEFRPTKRPLHATELARDASRSVDLVIACGGDGTIQEVATGMALTKTPLAILPAGTANVLARELNLPRSPLEAADLIPSLVPREIAVGKCGEDYFLLMAGVGMDAAVIGQVDPRLKSRIGIAAFWYAGVRRWSAGGFEPLTVTADGTEYRCSFVVAARASRYGGSLRIARHASLFSEQFALCMFSGESRRDYLRYLAGIISGTHHRFGDVICTSARTVEVSSQIPVRFQLDGELKGSTPLSLSIVPEALTIVAPNKTVRSNSQSREPDPASPHGNGGPQRK